MREFGGSAEMLLPVAAEAHTQFAALAADVWSRKRVTPRSVAMAVDAFARRDPPEFAANDS